MGNYVFEAPRSRERFRLCSLLVPLCVLLGACTPSPQTSGRERSYEEIVPVPADAGSASRFLGWGPGPVSGAPVRVLWFNDDSLAPEKTASARVAALLVNEELGGVAGRALELVECTEPARFRSCAAGSSPDPVLALVGYGVPPDFLDTLAGLPLVLVEPSGLQEYRRPSSVTFSLTRAGILRAAAHWLGRGALGRNDEVVVLVPAGAAEEAEVFVSGLRSTVGGLTITEVDDRESTPDVVARLERLLEATRPDAIVVTLGSEGCVALQRALESVNYPSPLVVTSGQCASKHVYEILGDWSNGWVHVSGGVDLVNYDDDEHAALYRDRFRRHAGPTADSTASTALVFSALLDTVRLLAVLFPPGNGDVEAALVGYDGPLFAAAGRAGCGRDPSHPVLCLHAARMFRYEGRRCSPVTTNLPGRPETLVETCVNEWTNVTGEPGVIDVLTAP